jgi:CheY-like chemotaxis protein
MAAHTEALRGLRILVVEDEPLIALDLQSLLTGEGAVVEGPGRDLEEGLRLARRSTLAAALLDVRIGRQTAAPIAELLQARGVPFAFYTGQVEADALRREWPGAPVVPKPSPARQLLRALEDLCAKPPTPPKPRRHEVARL